VRRWGDEGGTWISGTDKGKNPKLNKKGKRYFLKLIIWKNSFFKKMEGAKEPRHPVSA